jgi:tetratricopeptide (TPR) repeat protein
MQASAAIGDRNNETRTLNDFAGVYYSRGDLRQAEQMWREATKRFRQLDERDGSAAAYNNLGDVLFLQGHLVEARKMLIAAIPEYEAIEESSGVALVLNDLGDLSRAQGDLQAAEANYQRAKGIASGISDNSTLAYVLSGEGDVQMDRGDLTGARKSYADALHLRTQIGEVQNIEETNVRIAKLSIEEGLAAQVGGIPQIGFGNTHLGRSACARGTPHENRTHERGPGTIARAPKNDPSQRIRVAHEQSGCVEP